MPTKVIAVIKVTAVLSAVLLIISGIVCIALHVSPPFNLNITFGVSSLRTASFGVAQILLGGVIILQVVIRSLSYQRQGAMTEDPILLPGFDVVQKQPQKEIPPVLINLGGIVLTIADPEIAAPVAAFALVGMGCYTISKYLSKRKPWSFTKTGC